MTEAQQTLAVYLHLARASELRRRWLVRDKLLLLSAYRAHHLQLDELAERCRKRLLAHNPGHLLGRFSSVAEASQDEGVIGLCRHAERIFPRERAEYLLQSLGVEMGSPEATYATPEEYLQSILGPAPRLDGATGDLPNREQIDDTRPSVLDASKLIEPTLTETEIAAQERRELRTLLVSLGLLTLAILGWSAFLLKR